MIEPLLLTTLVHHYYFFWSVDLSNLKAQNLKTFYIKKPNPLRFVKVKIVIQFYFAILYLYPIV